jgi:hypothetical protein
MYQHKEAVTMTWTRQRRSLRLATAAGVSLAALGLLAACNRTDPSAAAPAAQAGAAPMLVNCGPGQQPLIRHVSVNGTLVPQFECVHVPADPAITAQTPGAPMMAPQMAAPAYPQPMPASAYGYAAAPVYPPPATVYTSAPRPAADPYVRPASHRIVYDDDVVTYRSPKQGRTWQKSAIIIGSSAGVGAGVGAATGGRKGALIGAAIGGGSATIWDQATRR